MTLSQRIREYLAEHGPCTTAEVHAGLPDVKARNKIAMSIGSMRRAGMVEGDGATPALWSLSRDVRRPWKYATEEEREQAAREVRERNNAHRRAAGAFARAQRGGTRQVRGHFLADAADRRAEIAQERLEKAMRQVRKAQDELDRARAEAAELRAQADAELERRKQVVAERRAEAEAKRQAAAARRAAEVEARKKQREAEKARAKKAARKAAEKAARKPTRKPVVLRPPVVTPKPPPVQKQEVPTMTVEEFLARGGQVERVPAAWEEAA